MTMNPKLAKTALITLALMAFAAAAPAATVEVKGARGGSSVTTGSCAATGGTLTCQSHADVTGPNGGTGTRDRATTATKGRVTTTLSGTRTGGRTFGRTTTITR